MKTHNPDNERIKRAYFTYLVEAQGLQRGHARRRREGHQPVRDLHQVPRLQGVPYRAGQGIQGQPRGANEPSDQGSAEQGHALRHLEPLKQFFIWLAGQPGYKSQISYSDAEYFNLSAKEMRIAKARREDAPVPTLEQIRHVIRMMPASTEIERRDRALVAFTILTGARDGATASLKLKHVDIPQGQMDQDARQVNTKFSKTFTTWFFPVGDDILQVVVNWVAYLRQDKLWGLDDPLFPATKIVVGNTRHFEAAGLDRKHWSGAGPIRDIFKRAFAAAGLPYFNPHSFPEDVGPFGRPYLQVSRGVQGLVPEPRPRECLNDIFELWRCRSAPPGRDHPRAWHVRATCRIGEKDVYRLPTPHPDPHGRSL